MTTATQQRTKADEPQFRSGEALFLAPKAVFSREQSVTLRGWSRDELYHALIHHEKAYYPATCGTLRVPPSKDMQYCETQGFLKPYRVASPFALSGGTTVNFDVANEYRRQVIIGFKALRNELQAGLVVAPSYSNFEAKILNGRNAMGIQWELQAAVPIPKPDTPLQDWFEARHHLKTQRGKWMELVSTMLPAVLSSETPESTLNNKCFELISEFQRVQRIADKQGLAVAEVTMRVILEVGQETFEALEQYGELFSEPGPAAIQALSQCFQAGVRIKRGIMKVRNDQRELYSNPIAYPVLFHKRVA